METNLQQQLTHLLGASPFFFGPTLYLQTEQGRVVLYGTVSTWYLKQMVQETIRQVHGVSEIENKISVETESRVYNQTHNHYSVQQPMKIESRVMGIS